MAGAAWVIRTSEEPKAPVGVRTLRNPSNGLRVTLLHPATRIKTKKEDTMGADPQRELDALFEGYERCRKGQCRVRMASCKGAVVFEPAKGSDSVIVKLEKQQLIGQPS